MPGGTGLAGSLSAQVAGSGFNALVSFALMLFVARAIGPAGFGEFIALLGFATAALMLVEGGWPTLVYRESVAAPGHEPARALRLARAGAAHVLLAGALGALTSGWLWDAGGLAAGLACMTAVAAMNLVSARLRAVGRFAADAVWQAAGRLASALAIVAVVLWLGRTSPAALFGAWTAGLLAVLLLAGRRQFPAPRPGRRADYALALPFVAVEGLSTLAFKSDVALMRVFDTPPEALSMFAAATRFNEAALLLCAPAANVMLKALRERAHDPPASARLASRTLGIAAAAGLLAWLGAWAAGRPLVALLFGPSYAAAGDLLGWTALALPFALPALVAVQALIARHRERRLLSCLMLATLLLAGGLALGMHWGGLRGAALGLAGAHALLFVSLLVALRGGGRDA